MSLLLLAAGTLWCIGRPAHAAPEEALLRQAREAAAPHTRARAVFELRARTSMPSGEVAAFFIQQAAHERDPDVLRQLISGLEQSPPEHAVAALLHLLDTATDDGVRQRVVEALFRFRASSGVVEKLQTLLVEDPSPAVRRHVPLWLGLIQGPRVLEVLQRAYERETAPEVKAAIIQGIALQRAAHAERFLARIAIQDRNATLRLRARTHLGFRRGERGGAPPAQEMAGERVMECDVSRAAFEHKRP